MILLQRDRTAIPANYRSPRLHTILIRLLEAYYDNAGKVPFNDKKQKSRLQLWAKAKDSLKLQSFDKCAYCESLTAVVAYGDVEHFRPKDIYWWLAFSYDNYTFSCQICNQKFKGANFPVTGRRLKPPVRLPPQKPQSPGLAAIAAGLSLDPEATTDAIVKTLLAKEKAHLPHPYLDDPEMIFAWKADDTNREIWLTAINATKTAKHAVKAAENYLGLNREELRRARYAQYRMVYSQCQVILAVPDVSARNEAIKAVREAAHASQPYAAMTRYYLRQWGLAA